MPIKVSVIVPVYNVEAYLDRCVRSLLDQTLRDIELILVDDGSTDGCPALCDAYRHTDPRVNVIHQSNSGLGEARNTGLDHARGTYIAFVDSDDFVEPTIYEHLYAEAMRQHVDTALCGYDHYDGRRYTPDHESITRSTLFAGREAVDGLLMSMIGMSADEIHETRINVSVWRGLYSADIIERHHIRFVSERLVASEDISFDATYYPRSTRVCYLPETLYHYRYNPRSISHTYTSRTRPTLIASCTDVKQRLAQCYPEALYHAPYRRHLYRNLKALIRREAQRDLPFIARRRALRRCIDHPVFEELFDGSFNYKRLPLPQQILYLTVEHRMTGILILLITLLRR